MICVMKINISIFMLKFFVVVIGIRLKLLFDVVGVINFSNLYRLLIVLFISIYLVILLLCIWCSKFCIFSIYLLKIGLKMLKIILRIR